MASLEELRNTRISKLENLKNSGNYPYPARVKKTHTNFDLYEYFDTYINSVEPIWIAGRIKSLRLHGGSAFFDVEDNTGEFQVFVKKDKIGDQNYNLFESNADVGDFVEASGHLFKTKQDAKTLEADSVRIISKVLRPIPEEWYGLKDVEERLRHRYLDLILNKGVKENFRARSQLITDLRKFLAKEGFMEVETPILQPIAV
jgi:lysyl-tRNA synthetase class 2